MSRASFAKRFTDMVGQPMFTYLSQLRMQKAKELLHNTTLPVDDIAMNIGYESERAFTKTFAKYVGTPPRNIEIFNFCFLQNKTLKYPLVDIVNNGR